MSNNKKKTRESLDLKRRLKDATSDERASLLDGLPYEVGFGKPPLGARFKPGQSGNRRGRPPKSKDLATILREELEAQIVVNHNGKRHKLTKWQVAVRQQVNKAVADKDLKAFMCLAELARHTRQLEAAPAQQAAPIDDRDLAAVAELRRLYEESAPDPEDAPDADDGNGEPEPMA
ncbi:DUF5681 domain-containing protein [Rhodoplanes roseus]|uniref:DUF5681 domain-containing protein n=1 Tax=Rhodoplanes roseus TaxID=29409 RepID=A0A327L1S6_9BRAD|nr:DUF5681 domain-containing protein [Rhodoplanes roseus]RAI43793.1 hypothetical protein CH341_12450 [Rhodoplanes roseus]